MTSQRRLPGILLALSAPTRRPPSTWCSFLLAIALGGAPWAFSAAQDPNVEPVDVIVALKDIQHNFTEFKDRRTALIKEYEASEERRKKLDKEFIELSEELEDVELRLSIARTDSIISQNAFFIVRTIQQLFPSNTMPGVTGRLLDSNLQ